jgi:NADH-quinone oxidoreductase subunit J
VAETLFYVLAVGSVAFGAGVISAKMPLYSVLCLLGTFFCLAGIFLLAGFQFLAATQLLVYAGAIMVLFLFVIMLLNLGDPKKQEEHSGIALRGGRLAVAGAAAALLAVIGIAGAGWGGAFELSPELGEKGFDSLPELATVLFSRYVLPFEAASLLLLATMIAVVALAKRSRPGGDAPRERAGWPWQKGVGQ